MLAGLVAVPELFVRFGSGVAAGAVTVAVLLRLPVVPLGTVPDRLNVAVPPATRLTVVAMLPEPLAAPQTFGAVVPHVQVYPAPCKAAGSGSFTVAPTTAPGPLFVTMTV